MLFTGAMTPSKQNIIVGNESISPSGKFQSSDIRSVSVGVQVRPEMRSVETCTTKNIRSVGTSTHTVTRLPLLNLPSVESPGKSSATTSDAEFVPPSSSSSEMSSDLAESQQRSLLLTRCNSAMLLIEKILNCI